MQHTLSFWRTDKCQYKFLWKVTVLLKVYWQCINTEIKKRSINHTMTKYFCKCIQGLCPSVELCISTILFYIYWISTTYYPLLLKATLCIQFSKNVIIKQKRLTINRCNFTFSCHKSSLHLTLFQSNNDTYEKSEQWGTTMQCTRDSLMNGCNVSFLITGNNTWPQRYNKPMLLVITKY